VTQIKVELFPALIIQPLYGYADIALGLVCVARSCKFKLTFVAYNIMSDAELFEFLRARGVPDKKMDRIIAFNVSVSHCYNNYFVEIRTLPISEISIAVSE